MSAANPGTAARGAFSLSDQPIDLAALRATLADPHCGGYASFEGWVRNHNEGQQVLRLEYEAFAALCRSEGERILAEARERFGVHGVVCAHRVGLLALGEVAVFVAAAAAHRDEAFRACRYVIDEVKHRLPIWKKEHYVSGDSGWVNCERCATAHHDHGHGHGHGHDQDAPGEILRGHTHDRE
jgi:molybdopterin synthase catalytic subunit